MFKIIHRTVDVIAIHINAAANALRHPNIIRQSNPVLNQQEINNKANDNQSEPAAPKRPFQK